MFHTHAMPRKRRRVSGQIIFFFIVRGWKDKKLLLHYVTNYSYIIGGRPKNSAKVSHENELFLRLMSVAIQSAEAEQQKDLYNIRCKYQLQERWLRS